MKLITEYSLWYIPLCLLGSVLLTALLYYRNTRYNHFSRRLYWILASLRFLALFLLCFLLLKPLIQYSKSEEIKPKIAVLQDNSESIWLGKDSTQYLTSYREKFNKFVSQISQKYQVDVLPFSDEVYPNSSLHFKGKKTNISDAMDFIKSNYTYDNLGATVLISDGLFNIGRNPQYLDWSLKSSIYTLGLGDTSLHKDLYFQDVWYNKKTFINHSFPIELKIAANLCQGETSRLTVRHNQEILFSKDLTISSPSFYIKEQVLMKAKRAGLQKYTIQLEPINGELSTKNNTYEVFIEVLDLQHKILLLASSPHPDVSALQSVMQKMDGLDVDVSLIEKFNHSWSQYHLIILHQPFSDVKQNSLIASILKSTTPVLCIAGKSSNIGTWNNNITELQILNHKHQFQESEAMVNREFSSYTISPETEQKLGSFPPLNTPFGEYKLSANTQIFAHQRISGIKTQMPLICYTQDEHKKMGFIMGEGLWRWKMYDYRQNGSFDAFYELISKPIQYLTSKENKDQFQVRHSLQFLEDERIDFEALLYNDNMELINTPEVALSIQDSAGKTWTFSFQKTQHYYTIDVGFLPLGSYTWKASVNYQNRLLEQKGQFSVMPVQLEALQTQANHQILYKLAHDNGGKLFYENQFDLLAEEILNSDTIKPEIKHEKSFVDLVEWKWLFFLIIALLTAEWFIKKYNSSY